MAVLLLAGGCAGPDDHDHPQLRTGQQLYEHHCGACHQGGGDGAFLRGVPPVRFTTLTYAELVDHIRGYSRPTGTRMPLFSTMPREEAEKIAIYVRQKLKLD